MKADKLLSLLLQYPTPELLAARADIAASVDDARERAACVAIRALVAHWDATTLASLQKEYVETFDFDRRASLHLTYHTHGDRRQRGLELVRLKRRYVDAGLELGPGELPDYVPVILEFAALAPEPGRELLAELREPLELVRSRLHERRSVYAGLLDAIVASLPRLSSAQVEAIRRLADAGPPTELVGLEPFAPPELASPGSTR